MRPTLADLAAATYLSTEQLQEIESLLVEKKQIILEGPPGSGKTFIGDKMARYFVGAPLDGDTGEQVVVVQFHQSYGYEDFVHGIRPETNTETHQIEYHVRDGIFKRLCETARLNPDRRFVILIHRGNISRIFGELLLLLEYRDKQAALPHAKPCDPPFTIPSNIYLIGTMNTTDRSLAQIDYALRRRFYFYRLLPMVGSKAPVLESWLSQQDISEAGREQIPRLFMRLNTRIQEQLGKHFQVGHSYFMRADIGTPEGRQRVWAHAIYPLLEEYFFSRHNHDQVMAQFSMTT